MYMHYVVCTQKGDADALSGIIRIYLAPECEGIFNSGQAFATTMAYIGCELVISTARLAGGGYLVVGVAGPVLHLLAPVNLSIWHSRLGEGCSIPLQQDLL